MKKIASFIVFIGLILLTANLTHAQVGINNDDPKSTLDIQASATDMPSNTDGILVPRIGAFPSTDPGADQDGMMVFLTAATGSYTKGFHYWDNADGSWVRIGEFDQEWLQSTNSNGDDLIYAKEASLNGTDIVYLDNGRIGIGTDEPSESLEIRSNGDNDFQLTSANANPPNIIFLNTGGTVESPAVLPADQEIGSIIVKTNDGSQLVEVGGFRFYADGTPSVGSVPSAFVLSNTPSGSISQLDRLTVRSTGNIGFSVDDPTATLHLRAGTASSGSAPIKLSSGTNLTTPEAGAIEFDGSNLYFTPNTSRKIMLTGLVKTTTLDFPSISVKTTAEKTVTVTGATTGSTCSCAPNSTIETGLSWSCYVSAANTVIIRLANVSAAAIDPASKSWKVTLID